MEAAGVKPQPEIAILGCERSGSTWLTNIFDSHPGVQCLVEPWAPYCSLFPMFPERHVYVGEASAGLLNATRLAYSQLEHAKFPGLYRPGRPFLLNGIDETAAAVHSWIAKLLRLPRPSWAARRDLLSLNQADVKFGRLPKKGRASIDVVKELRLNFKVPLLAALWPDTQYVITIRHPGAQLSSIMNQLSGRSLTEFVESLPTFVSVLAESNRLCRFRGVMERPPSSQDLESILALWWMVSYDVLLTDLTTHGLSYTVVRHEDIAADPGSATRALFRECGLTMTAATEEYVTASSSSQPRAKSATETVRVSREHSTETITSALPTIRQALDGLADRAAGVLELAPPVADYLTAALTSR